MFSAPTPEYVIVQFKGFEVLGVSLGLVIMRSSRYMDRARPMTSKPGPILAEEQGTSVGVQYGSWAGWARRARGVSDL